MYNEEELKIIEDLYGEAEVFEEENVVFFRNPSYHSAIIGHTDDYHLVYDYDLMVEELVLEGMTVEEAVDFISYNTIRSLNYYKPEGCKMPLIMYKRLGYE